MLRLTDIRADSSYRGQLGIYANEANRAAETGLYIGMNPASVTGPTSFYQNNAAYIVNKLNAPLYLATNNTIRVTIDGSGHVSIPSGELRAKWLHSTEAGDNTFAGNVGIGTTAPVAKLTVAGDSNITGYEVITGNYTNNPYNSTTGARLMFGGGDANAQTDYYIGTNLEDYGGNYNKLDLRWHTGIRMGAQPGYGGIRFYDTEDLGTKIFSIGETDGNVRVVNNLYVGSAGGWMTDLLNAKMTSTGITEDTYVNLRVIRNNSVNGPDGMYIGYGQPEAIRFYSNTTEVARFNQGNQTFDVYGGAYVSGNVVMAGTELNNLNASNFYINANGSAQIRIDADQATAAGDNIFKINNGANATVLTVDESGNGTFSGTLTVGGKISGVSAPTTDTDAANKAYVDAAVAGLNRKFQVFLSSGTWTRPAGVDTVWVTMCGGGGGGNSGNFYSGGGGGGAGQVYIAYPVAVSGNVSVTIGSGGTAGGGDGQSTSFGSLLIADGGGGGGIGDYQFVDSAYLGIGGYGGRGGGGKGGNIYNTGTGGGGVNGGAGGPISGAGGAGGGGGAGTIFGFGGRGGTLVGGTSPEANTCAGGGGGGGNNNGGNASAAGGSGRVIVEWYE